MQEKDLNFRHPTEQQQMSLHQNLLEKGRLLAKMIPIPLATPSDTVFLTDGSHPLAGLAVVALW